MESYILLGQKRRFLPGQYDQVGKLGKGTDLTRIGKVVYINKPHQYFILEAELESGNTYRESFKFSQIHKGLIR
jgi:hypothetical protein